jgi:hypothetical protein
MFSTRAALTSIGAGVLLLVCGIYGVIGPEVSIAFVGLGLLIAVVGVVLLALVARPWDLCAPHKYVLTLAVLAVALHGYEHFVKSEDSGYAFFVWAMAPYGLALFLSSFSAVRSAVIAGAVIALAVDLLAHHEVFISPSSSTSALLLLFVPLWSTAIVVPVATFLAWLSTPRLRANAP